MDEKLYIGNLPFRATEQDIERFFSDHGISLEANICFEAETLRHRGFAFGKNLSQLTIDEIETLMDGKTYLDRNLTVMRLVDDKEIDDLIELLDGQSLREEHG